MIPADLFAPFMPVVDAFEELRVSYHVGGSVASSFWGVPRSTLDADLVSDLGLEHVEPLVARLQGAYYIDRGMIEAAIRARSSFNLIHFETMFKIDIFVRKLDPFEDSVSSRVRLVALADTDRREIRIASPEDTILHKLLWYRMGAEVSERQWLDILGVIRVQGATLDSAYLRHWADRLDLGGLLDKALAEAAQG